MFTQSISHQTLCLESAPAVSLAVISVGIGATGIHIGEKDDAPGAALIGILLMIAMVAIGSGKRRAGNSSGIAAAAALITVVVMSMPFTSSWTNAQNRS